MRRWLLRQRGTLFLAALLVIGAIIGQAVAERSGAGEDEIALASGDARPRGALALSMWLERLGYRVTRMDQPSALDEAHVAFVLAPIRAFSRDEATALVSWVRRGGTLVYLPGRLRPTFSPEGTAVADSLGTALDVGTRFATRAEDVLGREAVLPAPRVMRITVGTRTALDLRSNEWVPLAESESGDFVYAASRQLGQGRAYVASSELLFSNSGLGQSDNAALMLNILARAPGARAVVFEEAHHRLIEAPDLWEVMRASPWGWALWYAAALTFAFMVWGGRRFGPPVVAANAPARSTGEYISAFAGLLQRARATDWLQKRYAALVRRRLAVLLGVRADLPSDELARLVAERRPIDRAALTSRLNTLDGPPVGERSLLDLVRELEEMLRAEKR